MPVSTRSSRKRWPPNADHNDGTSSELTLPSELYWKYIRPFTPINDRAILNKRTGSTQFYAGDRVALDLSFLQKHGRVLSFTGIPRATGEPGAFNFCISFDVRTNARYNAENDPDEALEMLRNTRRVWDEHIRRITSPSDRLHACLKVFCGDDHPDLPVEVPLLFSGEGTAKDVVALHFSMNQMSINGPCSSSTFRREFLPQTLLGDWVDQFWFEVDCDMSDGIASSYASQLDWIVSALFDAKPDVSQFFEPLDTFPNRNSYARFFESGMSVAGAMRADALSRQVYEHHWIIEKLGEL